MTAAAAFLIQPFAARAGVGIFDGHGDVGAVLHKGSVEYDASNGTYRVAGSGENMWFASDAFYFVWKKVSGDVSITADIDFPTAGGNAHKKAALMIRQSLDADSAYADAALHGNGLTSLQSRETAGANTHEIQANVTAPKRLRITREGKFFYMSVAMAGEELHPAGGAMQVEMHGPYYVGIAVCAHDKDAVESAVFRNVQIAPAATGGAKLYSTIETMTVASTDRRVVYFAPGRIENAYWRGDNTIGFAQDGRWYGVPVDGGTPVAIASGVVTRPGEGGSESPDGKRAITYLRHGDEVTLQMRTLNDGKITTLARITGSPASLTPALWSPDGKRIVFVSYQMLP